MSGKRRGSLGVLPADRKPSRATSRGDALTVTVRVVPRASRDELGFDGTTLRARLTAPPVDGAANEALVELLASRLGVARRSISIVRGATSRTKSVSIEGLSAADLLARMAAIQASG